MTLAKLLIILLQCILGYAILKPYREFYLVLTRPVIESATSLWWDLVNGMDELCCMGVVWDGATNQVCQQDSLSRHGESRGGVTYNSERNTLHMKRRQVKLFFTPTHPPSMTRQCDRRGPGWEKNPSSNYPQCTPINTWCHRGGTLTSTTYTAACYELQGCLYDHPDGHGLKE